MVKTWSLYLTCHPRRGHVTPQTDRIPIANTLSAVPAGTAVTRKNKRVLAIMPYLVVCKEQIKLESTWIGELSFFSSWLFITIVVVKKESFENS